jgi:circadian clock protein KaiC
MDRNSMPPPPGTKSTRISTGVAGLDDILGGGLEPHRLYLIEGEPGTGKSTLGLQFLLEGVKRGERGLYVTLSETTAEVQDVAASHGWKLDGIDVFDLSAAESTLNPKQQTVLLHTWEVELGETVKLITDQVERTGASRVMFDSLSELRLLAEDGLRFRRQVLALKQFFAGRQATVLFLDDLTDRLGGHSMHLYSLCQGAISLERIATDFGSTRRRLEIAKMRSAPYSEGWHDYVIARGGLRVFPRLIASQHHRPFVGDCVDSGLPELNKMLHGGPLRGTCTLLTGPAGTGKSTLALQYVHAAAERGEHCAVYEFDERTGTLLTRMSKLGLDLGPYIGDGRVVLRQIDLAEVSPGEFDYMLRQDVEKNHTRIVVIDSLSGYLMAMAQERQLILKLHELLSYLNQTGVLTLMVSSQNGVTGAPTGSLNVSHLADTIVLLSFFEAAGHVRKGLSIVKNRGGGHEDAIRELQISPAGLRIGEVLTTFEGVLSGNPIYTGPSQTLLKAEPVA